MKITPRKITGTMEDYGFRMGVNYEASKTMMGNREATPAYSIFHPKRGYSKLWFAKHFKEVRDDDER